MFRCFSFENVLQVCFLINSIFPWLVLKIYVSENFPEIPKTNYRQDSGLVAVIAVSEVNFFY